MHYAVWKIIAEEYMVTHKIKKKKSCSIFYELLSFFPQTSRPEAFPHPHRLPAEGNRIGTNRPCSQVSASPL